MRTTRAVIVLSAAGAVIVGAGWLWLDRRAPAAGEPSEAVQANRAPKPRPTPEPAPDGPPTVPADFRGQWTVDLARCAGGSDESRLRIGADSVRFHESGGPIGRVTRRGASELTLVARLSGEGESRRATYRFRLSGDRRALTDVTDAAGGRLTRYRCP